MPFAGRSQAPERGARFRLGIADLQVPMYDSLNSLKRVSMGDYIGTTIGLIKGDTRSLDYSSNRDDIKIVSLNPKPETLNPKP